MYSIESIPKLLFEKIKYQHQPIKIHALASSFLIIDSQTRQLHQLNITYAFRCRHLIELQHGTYLSLLSTVVTDPEKLAILSDGGNSLAIWDANERTIQYVPMSRDTKVKISRISAIRNAIVLFENDQRAHLWRIGEEKSSVVEGCDQIRLSMSDDGNYLHGVSYPDSSLLMYQTSDGRCVEKLYIENLSPMIQISNDRVIISTNNELVMVSIIRSSIR